MINPLMQKQKLKNRTVTMFMAIVLTFGTAFGIVNSNYARADEFDRKIKALRQANDQNQAELEKLESQAYDLQTTINKLQGQVNALQDKIVKNQAKRNELKKEISLAEADLERKKDLLEQNIRAIYIEGEISTLEMLASSQDLSEFLDQQEYRNAIQDQIKIMLDKINELKAQLTKQKLHVENLIKEDTQLKEEIASNKARQSYLLGLNKVEQTKFNSDIEANKKRIEELRREQILANIALFGGGGIQPGVAGGGGYPWGNAYCVHTGNVGGPCYNYDWYFRGGAWDSWGYGFRNCTSWVGYKLAMDGKQSISYLGNANQWPSRAAARGHKVKYGGGAKAGDAAVNPNGYYGHVMYVEAVTGDNRVIVSDYNRGGEGYYRGPDTGNAGVLNQSGLIFIEFN
jgi:peptidoglycan DL-endopeptidase CwlO